VYTFIIIWVDWNMNEGGYEFSL